jgi:F420-0:gamma-glutamyl ligase
MALARTIGTAAYGIRAPIIQSGDDLVDIVIDSLLQAEKSGSIQLKDRDVLGITESLLARAQGNYVSIESVAEDISQKMPGDFVVLFPILSRNRFSLILKGLALSKRKLTVVLSYPSDEVGNHLMDIDAMDEICINPYTDVLTEDDYYRLFPGGYRHPFTGMDYIKLYKSLACDNNIQIVLANDYKAALNYAPHVLVAHIHDRFRIKQKLMQAGAKTVLGLDDLLNKPADNRGYNPEFGLLGSNQAGESRLKLFPRDCDSFVLRVQQELKKITGKTIEVMVYGDGAFKDPQGKIWELADPVVSPGYTEGLKGTPNEIKMKYVVDNELAGMQRSSMTEALKEKIISKGTDLLGRDESLGTTPRQLTDLLGSLCDLMSGSGDKGTPIILIQGYFDNYASD